MLLLLAAPAAASASSSVGVALVSPGAAVRSAQSVVSQALAETDSGGAAAVGSAAVATAASTAASAGSAAVNGGAAPTQAAPAQAAQTHAAPAQAAPTQAAARPATNLTSQPAVQISPASGNSPATALKVGGATGSTAAPTPPAGVSTYEPAPSYVATPAGSLPSLPPRDPAAGTRLPNVTGITIAAPSALVSPGVPSGALTAGFASESATMVTTLGDQLEILLRQLETIPASLEQSATAQQLSYTHLESSFPSGLAAAGLNASLPEIGPPGPTAAGSAVPSVEPSGPFGVTHGRTSVVRRPDRGAASGSRASEPPGSLAGPFWPAVRSLAPGAERTIASADGLRVGSGDHGRRARAAPDRSAPAAAVAVQPVPASLPTGAATGAASSGAGASTVALIALLAACVLTALLPGRMAVDLFPWASAFVALRLERPG